MSPPRREGPLLDQQAYVTSRVGDLSVATLWLVAWLLRGNPLNLEYARALPCGAIMTERRDHGRQGRQEGQGQEQQAEAVEKTGAAEETYRPTGTGQQQVTNRAIVFEYVEAIAVDIRITNHSRTRSTSSLRCLRVSLDCTQRRPETCAKTIAQVAAMRQGGYSDGSEGTQRSRSEGGPD